MVSPLCSSASLVEPTRIEKRFRTATTTSTAGEVAEEVANQVKASDSIASVGHSHNNNNENPLPNETKRISSSSAAVLSADSLDNFGLPLETSYAEDSFESMCSSSNRRNRHKACNELGQEQQQQERAEHESANDEQDESHHQEQQAGENQVSNRSQDQKIVSLEERVHELETKLLVLSRLLQMQRPNNGQSNIDGRRRPSPENSPGSVPPIPPPPFLHPPYVRGLHHTRRRGPVTPLLPSSSALDSRNGDENDDDDDDLSGERTPPQQIQSPLIQKDAKSYAAFPHLESPATFLGMDSDVVAMACTPDEEEDRYHVVESTGKPETATPKETRARNAMERESSIDLNESTPSNPATSTTPKAVVKLQRLTPDQRNLSFRILYGGDENTYQQEHRADPNAMASMTPAERRWLGASVMLKQNDPRKEEVESSNNTGNSRNVSEDIVRNKWLDYLNSFQESTHDVDMQMEEFVKVPGHVESIMTFGFFISVDCFLYIFTILPIRFIWSLLLLILRMFSFSKKPSPPFQFHRRHTYQMIQVFLLYVIYQYVLVPISIGKLYHWIRGQAMIKLYVLIAIVEVFDRLMCSLGQDCLDSMYWNAVNRPKSSRMLISVAVVLLYATCHTLLLFLHVATLNVAMNSADIALLALFISGNFAEIKSSVFKKYNKPALFKLTAADICERFKLGLFLGLVLLLNMCQGMNQGQFMDYVRVCAIVWCAELLADWVKHSFITKFNILRAKVYVEYALLLAGDFTGIGHEGVNLDHSHAVVKRIGFAQLPLVCVTLRLLREAAKYATINDYWPPIPVFSFLSVFVVWLVLLAVKLALGSLLHRISWNKLQRVPEIIPPSAQSKKKL